MTPLTQCQGDERPGEPYKNKDAQLHCTLKEISQRGETDTRSCWVNYSKQAFKETEIRESVVDE